MLQIRKIRKCLNLEEVEDEEEEEELGFLIKIDDFLK